MNTPETALPDGLAGSPELLDLEPGTDAYTLGLRRLLLTLRRPGAAGSSWRGVIRQSQLLQEWDVLETAHLRRFPPLQRQRHMLVLKPQLIVGDLDVLCYPFGLMMMFVFTVGLLFLGLGPASVALGCLGGMVAMWGFDRVATRVRSRALRSFGLTPASPPDRRRPATEGGKT